ncbi:solute carrier family 35 member F6-like [Liolophura sinensis]|uniref:solute carrier family 35 member F6-like n=1 Tax=Liolophura sinensis TaxID=3198878 RepID=UPI00315896B2
MVKGKDLCDTSWHRETTGPREKIFLKRKLSCLHWSGMFITMIGLVLVGISSVFKNNQSSSGSKVILGIVLIIASQLVSASQMVIEELFLKKRGSHPLQVVGMEGSFGFSIMAVIVLPAMYFIPGPQVNNSYENSLDAIYQIGNDYKLLIFCLLYLLSIAFYNYFGLAVTKSLTAVHRTLIDACRTLLVWVADLTIYYAFGGSFGEPFDKYWGLLQVDGFLFLLVGTALYNQLIDLSWLPCCKPSPVPLEVPGSPEHSTGRYGKKQIQEASDDEVQPEEVDERTRLLHRNQNLSALS